MSDKTHSPFYLPLDPIPRQDVHLPPPVGFVTRAEHDARIADLERQLAEARADAEQAVALAYQRAAAYSDKRQDHDIAAGILALADADALAEVERMRAAHEDTCAKLNGYITFAVEQQERAEAAEAEVARLKLALEKIADSNAEWQPEAQMYEDIARAALKGDTP